MKRLIGLLAAIILVVSGVSSTNAAPRMEIPETVFDFGYVPQNSKISHDFWLMSTGDDTLKILKVVPG